MEKALYDKFVEILRKELITATGCTEPIAIAFAAAKARRILGQIPVHCHVKCSGNVIKNVQGVVVPMSGGQRGIPIAATLGVTGGNADNLLDVLQSVTPEHIQQARTLVASGFCSCELAEHTPNLFISVTLTTETEYTTVEISNVHTNISRIEKNHDILLEENINLPVRKNDDTALLNIRNILHFADELSIQDVREILERQIQYNSSIAQEGMNGLWGTNTGKTLLEKPYSNTTDIRAAAFAAAGSDARMNGCSLPVVINSGSGNQGITISLPIYIYAQDFAITHSLMLRSLAAANLISIHQKKYIGKLSAYCGATSAACAAACGVAYMLCDEKLSKSLLTKEERYEIVCSVITNTICTIGGMVCDGAKSSCAAKIAAAVQTSLLALDMSLKKRVFQSGEGLTGIDVEETIASVGRMGREGMRNTDIEILNIMLGH